MGDQHRVDFETADTAATTTAYADVLTAAAAPITDPTSGAADSAALWGPGGTPDAAASYAPEEFERLAKQYADIQRGRTDIQFGQGDLSPEELAKQKGLAMEDMAKMMQTESGREMLNGLANNVNDKGEHRTTTLEFIKDPTKSDCTRPYGRDADEQWRTYANDTNGIGNNATVHYAPGVAFDQTNPDGTVTHHTGDTVLFHEMAHAYHRTRGSLAGEQPLDPALDRPDPMDSGIERDEYQATGLGRWWGDRMTENQYREDRRWGLGESDIDYRRRYSADGNYPNGPRYQPR